MLIRSKKHHPDTREGVTPACVDGVEGWSRNYKSYTCFYPKTHWEKVLDWITVPDYVTIHILAQHWPYLQKECIETNDNHYRFATGPISHHNKYTIIDFKLDKPLCE